MAFDALLGNDRLKENLISSLAKGRISHFYLISGPEGAGKRTLARHLAAAVLCSREDRPCGRCSSCRKVLSGAHPDVITVDDAEKKHVPVQLIRWMREDVFVRPNEAERKVYILPRAQDMRVEAQNALLKVLEEPPKYGVFLLLTDNAETLLPTVRSRCVELSLQALPDAVLSQALRQAFPQAQEETVAAAVQRSGGFLGQAKQLMEEGAEESANTQKFAQSFASADAMQLLQTLAPMEKWNREALLKELKQWLALLVQALSCRSGFAAAGPLAKKISAQRSGQEIMAAVQALQKCIDYTQSNVSAAAICGYLAWELR